MRTADGPAPPASHPRPTDAGLFFRSRPKLLVSGGRPASRGRAAATAQARQRQVGSKVSGVCISLFRTKAASEALEYPFRGELVSAVREVLLSLS